MSLLVVGSIALDSVTTPYGSQDDVLGGAASYFSCAASMLTKVSLVGVVGDDFPQKHLDTFAKRGIDLAGLERRKGAKTFRWSGSYEGKMDSATTRRTDLNVLASFRPDLPAALRACPFVFLANGDPVTQDYVLSQLTARKFVLLDTMNLWIDHSRKDLEAVLRRVDGVVLNDDEARSLAGDSNLIRAMGTLAKLGIRTLVVKKGEHGSILLHEGRLFALPAYPLEDVRDPTGAGDTFAAGFMGHLARTGDLSFKNLKMALASGTITASFTVEKFSLDRILEIGKEDLDRRLEAFLEFVRF
jgi:sugar/nucleoside kinase (ribokinase family)